MRIEIKDARALPIMECAARGFSKIGTARKLSLAASTVTKYAKLYAIEFNPTIGGLDLNEVRSAAGEGLTRKQAAARFGVDYQTIHRLANAHGIHFVRSGTGAADAERAEAMEAMYRGGKTLAEIGGVYGVSRERVRQILSKYQRISADDGGQAFKAKIARDRRRSKKEAECQARNGCSVAQYRELRRIAKQMIADGVGEYRTPIRAFASQRCNSRARGIEWKISLWEWWTLWQQSGKWEDRGRGQGFMMCRFGDTGAYEVGNVYIATGVHNGKIQPNNRSRKTHPLHAEFMQARAA